MVKRIAVYPGTFDPVTNGHLDLIRRALKIFDELIVAVARSPQKKPLFSVKERMEMLREVTKSYPQVKVDNFTGLLIDYAKKKKACAIIRGLRAVSDFDYEFQMTLTNRKLDDTIETIFLMPGELYTYLSSSIVKEVVGLGGRVNELVPLVVERKLQEKLRKVFRQRR